MNAYLPFDASELWTIAGWTMIQYFWLGAIVAAAAFLCRLMLRRAAPNVRYAAALVCLMLLTALPVGIAASLYKHSSPFQIGDGPWRGGFVGIAAHANANDAAPADIVQQKNATAAIAARPQLVEKSVPIASPTFSEPSTDASQQVRETAFAQFRSFVPYLPWIWIIGTPMTFALLAAGIIGTKRLRHASRTVNDGPITEILVRLAQSLRVTQHITIGVCDRIAAPVLVGILRPIILLPPAALTGWSPDEIEMVLLHELAHVRRWDNLVNLLQRLIESLLFFHPAVWLVSTWVRREREACCDTIVVGRTQRPHAYAELLVALAAQMPRSVLFHPAASSAMASGPLRARIRRILQLENDPMLISGKSFAVMLASLLVAATLTVLYVPTIGQAEESTTPPIKSTDTNDAKIDGALTENPEGLATSDLPYPVRFEVGASQFLDGDKITVLDVRGTAGTFEPGNVYRIKGTYTLSSRNQAQLSAFTTAKEAKDGTGPVWKIQTTTINRGKGTFELFLPMKARGWPHLSFYPAGTAVGNFGGIYFGTGDSLLKGWPDKVASQPPANATAGTPPVSKKFPSLEDQKLADLAWKRLKLELEPIGAEDLKRVKGLGYDGGVKVSATAASPWHCTVDPGYILVGLHVWPTNNMKDVAQILSRDDLEELAPLRCYFVTEVLVEDPNDSNGVIPKDTIVKGRLPVNFPEAAFADPGRERPVDEMIQPAATPFDPSAAAAPPVAALPMAPDATAPPATTPYDPLAANPMGLPPAPTATAPQALSDDPASTAPPSEASSVRAAARAAPAAASSDELEALREHVKLVEEHFKRIDAKYKTGSSGGSKDSREAAAYELSLAQGNLATADGKVVDALAKFKEAQAHAEEALKAVTASYEAGRVSQDRALEAARNLAEIKLKIAQLQKAKATPAPAAPQHQPDDPQSTAAPNPYIPRMRVQPPTLHNPAVEAPGYRPPQPTDPTRGLFGLEPAPGPAEPTPYYRYDGRTFDQWRQEWLTRQQFDALKALEAFSAAGYSRDAAYAILFGVYSEVESIAQHTRKYLSRLPEDDMSAVVKQLIDVLKTDLSTKRRVAAARALAAIGPNAEPALDMLKKTLASSDLKERIASAAAIKMIVGKDAYQKPVADVLGKELGITVVETSPGVWGALPREDDKDTGEAFGKFTEYVIDEQQKLLPKGE